MAAKYVRYHPHHRRVRTAKMTSNHRRYLPLMVVVFVFIFVARTAAADDTTTTAPSYTGRRGGLGRGDASPPLPPAAPAASTIDSTPMTVGADRDDPSAREGTNGQSSSSRNRGSSTGGGGGQHHASGIRNIEASTSPASAQAIITKNTGGTSQILDEGVGANDEVAADNRRKRFDFGGNRSIIGIEDIGGDDRGGEGRGGVVTLTSRRQQRRTRQHQHRRMWFTSDCDFGTGPSSYVSSSVGRDDEGAGLSPENPYRTIRYAVSKRLPCQTIHVMDGTYRNPDYGEDGGGAEGGGHPVVDLTGVSDLRITRHDGQSRPRVEFDGPGGFVGGTELSPVTNVEISGLEIVGPAASISDEEAASHRLNDDNNGRYRGRGIAVLAGHHVYLHNLLIHDCPGAGIMVKNADHVTVADSDVYSNARWSPNAESGIVISDPISIDDSDEVKMTITNNDICDNVNQIPYYDPEWKLEGNPRVAVEAGIDCPSIPACRPDDNATDTTVETCPWQCRYGAPPADFIIDGSGIVINNDDPEAYRNGRWEVSYNTCHRNGVNGILMRNVDRIVVEHNRLYDNGVTSPRRSSDDASAVEADDEREDSYGWGRPRESGLVVRDAGDDVTWWSNRVMARYDDDLAFLLVGRGFDGDSPLRLVAGGDNRVCRGTVDVEPADAVTPAPDPDFCIPVELPEDDEEGEGGVGSSGEGAEEGAGDTPTTTPGTDHPRKFVEVRCGDRCQVNSWPYIMKEAPYPSLAAYDACEQHCYQARFGEHPEAEGCRAFSLHSIYDLTNSGNVYCFLYKDTPSPAVAEEGDVVTPVECATDPFNTEGCSYSTREGRFFITPEDRVRYNVLDYNPQE